MFKMMGNLPKISQEMEQLKGRLAQLSAEGDAGAGMVRVKVNGQMQVVSLAIADEAMNGGDKEMLEDLVAAAMNDAVRKAEATMQEKMSGFTAGLQLPPGMKLPF